MDQHEYVLYRNRLCTVCKRSHTGDPLYICFGQDYKESFPASIFAIRSVCTSMSFMVGDIVRLVKNISILDNMIYPNILPQNEELKILEIGKHICVTDGKTEFIVDPKVLYIDVIDPNSIFLKKGRRKRNYTLKF